MILPLLPPAESSKFLIVCPTAISDETKAALESVVHAAVEQSNVEIEKAPVFTYLPSRAVDAGIDASYIGDLYEIGSRAKALGWTSIAVVDPLTIRQLEGCTRAGEDLEAHFVLLSAQEKSERKELRQYIRRREDGNGGVVARRQKTADMIQTLSSKTQLVAIECLRADPDIGYRVQKISRYRRGIVIRDPRGTVFSPDNGQNSSFAALAIDAALNTEPGLPEEIKARIVAKVEEETSIDELTAAPATLDWAPNVIEIHMMNHVSELELQEIRHKINTLLRHIDPLASYKLHLWRGPRNATRKDFNRLWQRLLYSNVIRNEDLLFIFLDLELWRKSTQLGVACWEHRDMPNEPEARKTGFEKALRAWNLLTTLSERADTILDQDIEKLEENGWGELVVDPNTHFFHDLPQWVPLPTAPQTAPPVFSLTKQYTEEELNLLKEAMTVGRQDGEIFDDNVTEEEKQINAEPYTFVPWKSESDGTLDDIAQILLECEKYCGGRRGHLDKTSLIICVDKQSFADKTVIIAESCPTLREHYDYHHERDIFSPVNEEEEERYRDNFGIEYGRLEAREAQTIWVNLAIANLSFVECTQPNQHSISIPRLPVIRRLWRPSTDYLDIF